MVVHDFRRTLTCSWPGSSEITLNVEEQGDGNERLLTKELLPKIVGFQKKWLKFQHTYTLKSSMKTAHLVLLMESDGMVIYQVVEFVQELCDNLTDVSSSQD